MKSVILYSAHNEYLTILSSDESAEVNVYKDKIIICKGTVQNFVELLFKYFFLSESANKARHNINPEVIIYNNLVLNLKNYTVKCRSECPEWWDEFQEKVEKYRKLLIFM